MDAARTHSTEGENQRTRCTCNVYAIIRFVNDELDSNINSGWFIDEYNAFKTQSELIFLPFAANWGCKPAHGSVGVTTMTKTFRKSVITGRARAGSMTAGSARPHVVLKLKQKISTVRK